MPEDGRRQQKGRPVGTAFFWSDLRPVYLVQ